MKRILYIIIPILFLMFLANHAQAGIIVRPATNLGLVGYWSFNEGTGSAVRDFSGYGNHGTWNGTGSRWTDGKFGKGARMVRANGDYVEISDNPGLRFGTGNFTVSAWVKFPVDETEIGWLGVVAKGYTSSAPPNTWGLVGRGLTYTNELRFTTYNDEGGSDCQLSRTFSDGWHLVTVTRSGGQCHLYDNGTYIYSWGSTANLSTDVPLRIGASGDTSRNWGGTIDEVRIYNRDLDASEVKKLYESGLTKIGSNRLGLVDPQLSANATISYVRENCDGYSPCYNSLSAWEAAFGGFGWDGCTTGDLTCLGKTAVARIDGTWNSPDTSYVLIDGWTTDASNYIHIYTTDSARHPGKWDETKYRLETTGDSIRTNEEYVHIDGVQFKMTTNENYRQVIYVGVNNINSDIRLSNNIFRGVCSAPLQDCESMDNAWEWVVNLKIWNNIFYDLDRCVKGNSGVIAQIYNNTVIGCSYGFYSNGAPVMVLKNNIAYNNADNYFGTFDDYSTNNLSGPTQTDAPGSNARNGVKVTFLNETADDFHLSPGDGGARGYGADLSNDASISYPFDIDRQPRTGKWDIGADQARGTVVGASQAKQVSDGLVGYWSFNGPDIDGNTAYDRSGNNNHGTIYGATPINGKVGQALSFDGVNDYVNIINRNNLDVSTFTVSVWINPNQLSDGSVIVENADSDTSPWCGWAIAMDRGVLSCANGDICIWLSDCVGNYEYIDYTYDPPINTWTHLSVSFDNTTKNTKFYINGVNVHSETSNYNVNFSDGTFTKIGVNVSNYFDGKIDEVRLYNRALEPWEIQRLYNLGR